MIVKEALANGRLASDRAATALGPRPDAVALAVALAQPWADTVLCGPATVAQLTSNLEAPSVTGVDVERFAPLAMEPAAYWSERSAMPWT